MEQQAAESWVKYKFSIKGSSGTLSCVVIGDYLTHKELKELEVERAEFADEVQHVRDTIERIKAEKKLSDSEKSSQVKKQLDKITRMKQEYVPTDFESYSINDKDIADLVEKAKDDGDFDKTPIKDD